MYRVEVLNVTVTGRPLVIGERRGLQGALRLARDAWRNYVDVLRRNNRRVVVTDLSTGQAVPFEPPTMRADAEARENVRQRRAS